MTKGFQKLQKVKPGSFNADELVQNYLQRGEFPKIHADFGYMVNKYCDVPEPSIDLGTCMGIMSIYNVANGRSSCVGIEGNTFDFNRCIPHEKVRYENFYITDDTFPQLEAIIKKEGTTLVTARRVISDIGIKDTKVVNRMSALFADNGVKQIVLQGRAKTRNPQVKLHCSELEAACFIKEYYLSQTHKDVFVLQLK